MCKECQMKKYLLAVLLLISSFFIVSNQTNVLADSNPTTMSIDTIYPLEVINYDYHNLSNVKQISANDNYIAYTTNNTNVIVYRKSNKVTLNIGGFNNIFDIKLVNNNQLIVVDYQDVSKSGTIKYIDLSLTEPAIYQIDTINISNLRLIDIFEKDSKVYIGLIRNIEDNNNEFELYTIDNLTSLTNCTSIFKKSHEFYNTASCLTINESKHFTTNSNNRLLICEYSSNAAPTICDILSNITHLKYIRNDEVDYLLAFIGDNMFILSQGNYTTAESNSFTKQYMQLSEFTDTDVIDNIIFICDSESKAIRSYTLGLNTQTETNLYTISGQLWLGSNDQSIGRFDNVSDIFIQGEQYIVSDSDNNRIQIISEGKETIVISNDIPAYSKPHGVLLDRNQNMYVVINSSSSSASSILKYTLSNGVYTKVQEYSSYNSQTLGLVSDSTIDTNNNIYLIDYTNNNLVALSQSGLQTKCNFSSLNNGFTANSTSKIEYLIKENCLVILNDNYIYLLDMSNPEEINTIAHIQVSNCIDISCDLYNIYTLCENTIKKININHSETETTMQVSENYLYNTDISNLSTFTCNPTNSSIVAFNSNTQAIVKFNCSLMSNQYDIADYTSSTALSKNKMPLAINIASNGIIYDYPYYKGNYYLGKTECIGIDFDGEYYRVLFENNNSLHCGYIHKDYVPNSSIIEYNTNAKTKVITSDQDVPVYKYPTLLKANNHAIITQILPTQTVLYVTSVPFPVQIDNKKFYLYENGNSIGFLFNANIIEDDNKHITYLHTENATINAIGESEINLYSDDKTTVIITLSNSERIYVDSYDKNSEYTKIIYKDTDMNTSYEGYIKTKYVEMDELDDNKIVLILIIIFSVVILIIIATSYIIIKKRK